MKLNVLRVIKLIKKMNGSNHEFGTQRFKKQKKMSGGGGYTLKP